MTTEEISKFINSKVDEKNRYVKIEFTRREPIYGIFLNETDFKDLSSKNFWRIVTSKNFDAFNKSGDASLARLFNGTEFTRLSLLTDEF